jgi:hypothetical protein
MKYIYHTHPFHLHIFKQEFTESNIIQRNLNEQTLFCIRPIFLLIFGDSDHKILAACLADSWNLRKLVTHSSKKSVNFYQTTWRHIPDISVFIPINVSHVKGLWTEWLKNWGLDFWKQQVIFIFTTVSRPARPAQPLIQWIMGALSLGVKQQGCEAGHSTSSSAKVKNCGAVPPLPHVFIVWCFIIQAQG